MKSTRFFFVLSIVLACLLLALSASARAELLVLESTVKGISRNASFPDNAIFNVPDGKRIKFLKKPGNTTHEIAGPYTGSLANYKPDCELLGWMTGSCGREKPSREPVQGATRSLSSPQQ